MSSQGDSGGSEAALMDFGALEEAIERAMTEIKDLRSRLARAEERTTQSDELLREFVGGKQDPAQLTRRVEDLEGENTDLRDKINRGRASVDQVLSQIQFLENRR